MATRKGTPASNGNTTTTTTANHVSPALANRAARRAANSNRTKKRAELLAKAREKEAKAIMRLKEKTDRENAKVEARKAREAKEAAEQEEVKVAKTPLFQLREQLIGSTKLTEGSRRCYTAKLTLLWGENWWLVKDDGRTLDDNQRALLADIKAEKKAVQELAKARGLSNIDKPWSDVLAYARGTKGKGVPGARRTLQVRYKDELEKLYKGGMQFMQDLGKNGAEDMCPPEIEEANRLIGLALKALGVDLATINLTK